MIGMSEEQLKTGLLWWRNSIYKELFDKAHTIYISIDSETSLSRLSRRNWKEQQKWLTKKEKAKTDGTLLTLHFINTLVYSQDGKKMTRNDRKAFIRNTQSHIIDTYAEVFRNEKTKVLEINGLQDKASISQDLKKQVMDTVI